MQIISIVIPVYYNESNLPETIPKIIETTKKIDKYNFELIFVDDGSGDNSLKVLLEHQKKFPNFF